MKATCRKTSGPSPVSRGDLGPAERPALRGVGEPLGDGPAQPLEELGDVGARPGAVAEQLARGLVGVGEPPAGLEPRQRHRQILEEMVGHEAGDLGAVQRHQQQVAPAVGARHGASARTAWPVAASTCTPSGRSGASARIASRSERPLRQRRGGGVLFEHLALGVDAQPGEAGMLEARRRRGRQGRALVAPEKRAAAPSRVTTTRPPCSVSSIATPFRRASRVSR